MPLPHLEKHQQDVVFLRRTGATIVLGTAGSGKTSMAMYRAAHLGNRATDHYGNTLLLTFNRQLATYIQNSLSELSHHDVTVETFHKFARGYLNSKNKMRRGAICDDRTRLGIIEAVRDSLVPHAKKTLNSFPLETLAEEIEWADHLGIDALALYVEALTERGVASTKDIPQLAEAILILRDEYRQRRQSEGFDYDYKDICSVTRVELSLDTSVRRYRHIVIDEGQDFPPEILRGLSLAIPPNGTLTFFADAAQQIYGSQISWRDAGFQIDDTRDILLFKQNYRNSRAIAQLALAISGMDYFSGTADIVEPISPTADGPKPSLVEFSNEIRELQWIAEFASQIGLTQSVAILLRTREMEDVLRPMLPRNSIRLDRYNNDWDTKAGVRYGTYHASKGLEFDAVIMPLLSEQRWSSNYSIDQFGHSSTEKDGRLIYVGTTRARSILVLTYSGAKTGLLPDHSYLYDSAKIQ